MAGKTQTQVKTQFMDEVKDQVINKIANWAVNGRLFTDYANDYAKALIYLINRVYVLENRVDEDEIKSIKVEHFNRTDDSLEVYVMTNDGRKEKIIIKPVRKIYKDEEMQKQYEVLERLIEKVAENAENMYEELRNYYKREIEALEKKLKEKEEMALRIALKNKDFDAVGEILADAERVNIEDAFRLAKELNVDVYELAKALIPYYDAEDILEVMEDVGIEVDDEFKDELYCLDEGEEECE